MVALRIAIKQLATATMNQIVVVASGLRLRCCAGRWIAPLKLNNDDNRNVHSTHVTMNSENFKFSVSYV
jgi:hypothetical protein